MVCRRRFRPRDDWPTGKRPSLYHLVHAAVLLALSLRPTVPRLSFILFNAGIVVFSGSLYVLALTNLKWLGAITPLGGLFLLGGWLALAIKPRAT